MILGFSMTTKTDFERKQNDHKACSEDRKPWPFDTVQEAPSFVVFTHDKSLTLQPVTKGQDQKAIDNHNMKQSNYMRRRKQKQSGMTGTFMELVQNSRLNT